MGKKRRCRDDDDNDLLLLPEDVLIQILLCLPVKYMLRFKSVCKSWRELIESSFFIDLHTTTTTFKSSSSSSNKFGAFIIEAAECSSDYSYSYEVDIKLYMLSCDQKKKKKMVFKVDDLGFLPFYKDFLLEDSISMVGSCNGIICLHDPEVMDKSRGIRRRQHYSNIRDVSLWNPATRQFRILPKSIPIVEKQYYMGNWLKDFIGFGFDVKTKDYKVLRITPWSNLEEAAWDDQLVERGCRVQVYSLSTDSWRLLEDINYLPDVPTQELFDNHGIYLNGCYFFLGRNLDTNGKRDLILLSFDFTKEIFTTMQLPENYSTCSSNMVLSSLGGKMALLNDCDGNRYFDIWVLNEHGSGLGDVNKEYSWTKLHSNLLFQMKSSRKGTPRCISNNGEFALTGRGNKLQLFNLRTKEAKKDFRIRLGDCRANVYRESLVSIMGGNVLLKWQLPTHGTTYRLNLDAPFIDSYSPFGIGLCLTSDTGGCIGVRSLQRRDVSDAEEGEALTILEAIKWAKELELSPIIIESDSKKCVSFFMDNDDDDDNNSTYWSSGALSLLTEAKLLLNSSELGISFQYCYKSCNYVTDVASKLGREGLTWTCKDWTANFPGEMVRSLSKDLGRERSMSKRAGKVLLRKGKYIYIRQGKVS